MDEPFDWEPLLQGAADDLDAATRQAGILSVAELLAFAQVQALLVIARHLGVIADAQERIAYPAHHAPRLFTNQMEEEPSPAAGNSEAGSTPLFSSPTR